MLFSEALTTEIGGLMNMVQSAQVGIKSSAVQSRMQCGADCIAKLPAGLVGFWPLDGDGTDLSGIGNGVAAGTEAAGPGNTGTAINGEWAAGLFGLAFKFDGDDMITVPTSPSMQVQRVTMLAWVHPTELDPTTDADIIMERGGFEMVTEQGPRSPSFCAVRQFAENLI
jgi:hypothetical protein